MKTFRLTTMIVAFLLLCSNRIQAQTTNDQLDQVELMKLVSEKTRINAYQKQKEFQNFQGLLRKGEKHVIHHPENLKA